MERYTSASISTKDAPGSPSGRLLQQSWQQRHVPQWHATPASAHGQADGIVRKSGLGGAGGGGCTCAAARVWSDRGDARPPPPPPAAAPAGWEA